MTGRHAHRFTAPHRVTGVTENTGYRPGFTAPTLILMADGRQLPISCLHRGDEVQNHLGGVSRVLNLSVQRLGSRRLCGFNAEAPFFTESQRFLATDGWRTLNQDVSCSHRLRYRLGPLLSGCRLLHWNNGYRKRPGERDEGATPLINAYDIEHIEQRQLSPATQVYCLEFEEECVIIADGFLAHCPPEGTVWGKPDMETPLNAVNSHRRYQH
ncbi:hypothetical protein [Aestuariirhabdus sp. LZHN29]|uniref:hypothetical protein n=1 Tax=Aestuariirhabdus sp. LZHN29 TaxID=3417462 RepID=UPI003CFBB18B